MRDRHPVLRQVHQLQRPRGGIVIPPQKDRLNAFLPAQVPQLVDHRQRPRPEGLRPLLKRIPVENDAPRARDQTSQRLHGPHRGHVMAQMEIG
jgi:hypothetical protein